MAVLLVINPRSDSGFVREAERLAEDGMTQPQRLEAALRSRYPDVAVHVRELTGEQSTIWYVYRDGHWIRDEEA